jgi:copper chaperone
MPRIEIPVEGMTCEGCERTVQSALGALEGVRTADADHEAKRVRVSFDADQVDEQRLREAIAGAGYESR